MILAWMSEFVVSYVNASDQRGREWALLQGLVHLNCKISIGICFCLVQFRSRPRELDEAPPELGHEDHRVLSAILAARARGCDQVPHSTLDRIAISIYIDGILL